MPNYVKELRELVGSRKLILVAAGCLIFNEQGHVLLQKRSDSETWGFPGGLLELGESVEQGARREVLEETGLTLGKMELFGIYSGPDKDFTLANGDEIATVKIIFSTREYEGEFANEDGETLETRFFPLDALPTKEQRYVEQRYVYADLLSGEKPPFIR